MIQNLKEEFGMIWVGIAIGFAVDMMASIVWSLLRMEPREREKEESIKRLTARLQKINTQLTALNRTKDEEDDQD